MLNLVTYSIPVNKAPYGLGTITLPDDDTSVFSLMNSLPVYFAGKTRRVITEKDPYRSRSIWYGHILRVEAANRTTSYDWNHDWPGHYLIAAATLVCLQCELQDIGKDGDILWVQRRYLDSNTATGLIYEIHWGEIGNSWTFSVWGYPHDELDMLIEAFVAAAKNLQ